MPRLSARTVRNASPTLPRAWFPPRAARLLAPLRSLHPSGPLRGSGYVRRWLVLGALIGLVAGLGAVAFFAALTQGTHLLLGTIGGYRPPTTVGEGGAAAGSGFARPWLLPIVVGGGGLVSGLLVFALAPEAEGHGTDSAIAAVHHDPTGLRPRAGFVKIVASAVTIGSGGSGGREGPTAQISATFASTLARRLNLTPADARIAVSAGIAAGIAAIFRAPLGGALLGAELPYRDDLEADALLPSLVASIVAFSVFGAVNGYAPIFGYLSGDQFAHASQLIAFALLGLLAGLVGRAYAVTFHRLGALVRRVPVPRAVLPGLAGLVVGAIGLAVPAVLGTGYGWVQEEMDPTRLATIPLWVVILLPFAKILATTLSIGSGGSGGIFGPGMVIGAATGAGLWRLLDGWFPGMHTGPAAFVIVGMTACFGAVAHAPLAVMLMVAEMTGNLSLLAPAMIAVALARVAVGDVTIYTSQLRTRDDSPAGRARSALAPAAAVRVRDAMAAPRVVLRAATAVGDAATALDRAGLPGAPVVTPDGRFVGSVARARLLAAAEREPGRHVGQLVDREAPTLADDAPLDAAAERLATVEAGWVPVLDDGRRVVGVLATADLIRGYRLALRSTLRRLHGSAPRTAVVETTVEPGSPADGCAVRDIGLPPGTTIVSVQQGPRLVFPSGDTVLVRGQVVSAVTSRDEQERLCALFRSPSSGVPAGGDGGRAAPEHVA